MTLELFMLVFFSKALEKLLWMLYNFNIIAVGTKKCF